MRLLYASEPGDIPKSLVKQGSESCLKSTRPVRLTIQIAQDGAAATDFFQRINLSRVAGQFLVLTTGRERKDFQPQSKRSGDRRPPQRPEPNSSDGHR